MLVVPTPQFDKDVIFYIKRRKYYNIEDDILPYVVELEMDNLLGDDIPNLNLPECEKVFKLRIPNSSANVGKSNGFRLIYYHTDNKIYLLTIYSKKDHEDISNEEIKILINKYCT